MAARQCIGLHIGYLIIIIGHTAIDFDYYRPHDNIMWLLLAARRYIGLHIFGNNNNNNNSNNNQNNKNINGIIVCYPLCHSSSHDLSFVAIVVAFLVRRQMIHCSSHSSFVIAWFVVRRICCSSSHDSVCVISYPLHCSSSHPLFAKLNRHHWPHGNIIMCAWH